MTDNILNNSLTKKVKSCIGNTSYTDTQIDNTLSNGLSLLNSLLSIDCSEYELKSDDLKLKGLIRINKYHFNHNDMLVYYNDYFTKKALVEIFNDWKDKKYITRYTSDGYGSALVLPFETDYKINSFEKLIDKIGNTVKGNKDDFDNKLKNIKYI